MVDARAHMSKLYLVIIVIVRFFKDWEWSNPWLYDLGPFFKGFEVWD
jgi:hypothetical protein